MTIKTRTITCYVPVCEKCERDLEKGGDFLPHYSTVADAQDGVVDGLGWSVHESDGKFYCNNCHQQKETK